MCSACMQLQLLLTLDMTPAVQVLRHATVMALGSEGPDVDVHCSDSSLGARDMDSDEACPSAAVILCYACIAILSLPADGPYLSIKMS